MQTPGEHAQSVGVDPRIQTLAALYDKFAFSLDPDCPEADKAEKDFARAVSEWYEAEIFGTHAAVSLAEFRLGVTRRCFQHLKAMDKRSAC